ncbi:aldose 1-epimerase-like [Thrips palmi]|uniref:Galactose mutarotase n=1 Tax=Thrips palmi TaxID=161013 RepID=A0A6P8Y5X7_THRPL|nr:aldose 1-epimerase-like [Thrips palmi]XP_034231397.1 aldose 1-epimerase-like [Thrips palmi]
MWLHAVIFVSVLNVVKPLDCCGPALKGTVPDATGPATPGVQVSSERFGNVSGQTVFRYTIKNKDMSFQVMNYGAYLTSITVPDKQGRSKDVLLGHDTLKEYVDKKRRFGAIIGRVANRIANSSFTLDGQVYKLNPSGSRSHYTIKGGIKGWDQAVWKASTRADGVTFSLLSPDGDEHFPGAVQAQVTYRLTEDSSLQVAMRAETTKATPINVFSHWYMNLAGHDAGAEGVYATRLKLNADLYQPLDIYDNHVVPRTTSAHLVF